MIMFDVTSRITYQNVPNWHRDLSRVCDNIPIALIGNKTDMSDHKVTAKNITFHRKRNIPYFPISAKTNFNFEKPFVWMLRSLTRIKELKLVEELALEPALAAMDPAQMAALMADAEAAETMPLPEGDEDL